MIDTLGDNLVFLLGIPRSGTTLLSALLDRHPQILCPPEPWIMLALESLGQTHPSHPADPQLLGDAVAAFCNGEERDQATRAFATALINGKLTAAGRSVFVDKTPRYYLILPALHRLFPKARYIWLIRNPLDVAASYLTSWNIDISRQLIDFPRHRACIDLVVGLRRLAEFARGHDRIYSLRYEDLAAQPAEAIARVIEFLGLPAQAGLSEHDLSQSPIAASPFGDQNIRQTDRPHQRSIDSWQRVLSDEQLTVLLRAVGVELFARLGYATTVQQLADRGIQPGIGDVADSVEAGLAERLAEVQSGATLRTGAIDEATVLSAMADLHPTAISALLAEWRTGRAEIPRLGDWAKSLESRLAESEAQAAHQADRLIQTDRQLASAQDQLAMVQSELSATRNEAIAMRAAKEQLERPGALLAVEFNRLKRRLRRWAGKDRSAT